MCEVMSWIEHRGTIKFLTGETITSEKFLKWAKERFISPDDYFSHGTIRAWFRIDADDGNNKECTDFSTPNNFPSKISDAIKSGLMRGVPIGTDEIEHLLSQPAWDEYEKICQPAWAEYEKICQPAWAEYKRICQPAWAEYEKIRQPAWDEYEKIRQPAWAEYEKICQPAWAEYKRICQPALAEYEKIRQPAWDEYERIHQPASAEYERIRQQVFWDLFLVNKNNRNPKWI